jgi:hypothetical protein
MAMNSSQESQGASPPPPGVLPNFDHPERHDGPIFQANIAGLVLATIFLSLRLYTKAAIVRPMGVPDCLFIG